MVARAMRRQDRALSKEETRGILERGEWGTLATVGADGWPYAVPVNYVLLGDSLFFHCAREGHKLDNIAAEPRVSFSVVVDVHVLPDIVSTAFGSATVTGRARMATAEEKHLALKALLEKYTFMPPAGIESYLEGRRNDPLHVLAIDIEAMSGKHRPDPGTWSRSPGSLHHVEIYVSDLERSRRFWSWLLGRLGYVLFQEWESGFSLKLGDTYLVFVQTEERFREPGYHRCRTGLNHLAFHGRSRADVDALTEELRARGATILYPDRHPHAGGEGSYAVFFEDPDRIKVEVCAPG